MERVSPVSCYREEVIFLGMNEGRVWGLGLPPKEWCPRKVAFGFRKVQKSVGV